MNSRSMSSLRWDRFFYVRTPDEFRFIAHAKIRIPKSKMSELSELYGPATTLPSSAARHLNNVIDEITSLPPAERSPNMRMWVDPNATNLYINSFPMQELHLQGIAALRSIYISNSQLERFPSIEHMSYLTTLELNGNRFTYIPKLSHLQELQNLQLNNGLIQNVGSLYGLTKLKILNLGDNQIEDFSEVAELSALENFSIYNNQLSTIDGIKDLVNLTYLYLYGNNLTALPNLDKLVKLQYFQCHDNQLTVLPSLSSLVNLYQVRFYDNQLSAIPDLTGLTKLRYVYIQNNQLSAAAIDNVLIQLAATGMANNGYIDYSANPGASDTQRSAAAETAKSTLMSRSWSITR